MAVVFHIDINAFFASAHVITNPNLEGKPLVVCSNHRGSVVTTASYEARKFGIHSAMPLAHAKRLCNELEVVDIDFELYHDLSDRFIKIIQSYSSHLEQASIDECYVDVTNVIKQFDKPLDLAVAIQKQVFEELRLPISIGVAPNKFLAKMASDMKKPNGITVLRIREVDKFLWPLPIEDMFGIGKKTVPRLKELGIHTIRDLAHANEDSVRPILGINTRNYIERANGLDMSQIVPFSKAKSVGQSKTFTNAMTDLDEIRHSILVEIEEMVRRLHKNDLVGKTITFSLRMEDFKTAARSTTLEHYTDDLNLIYEKVIGLYDEFEGYDAINFISVSISNLISKSDHLQQLDLFSDLENPTIQDIVGRLNKELKSDLFITTDVLLEKMSDGK